MINLRSSFRLSEFIFDLSRFISRFILPFGFILLLTGMFLIGDRSNYHRAFYLFFAFPAFLLCLLDFKRVPLLFSNCIFYCYIFFSVYMLVSSLWGNAETSFGSLMKRPLYVALLFAGVGFIALSGKQVLERLIFVSVVVALVSGVVSLCYFFMVNPGDRFNGYRALYNPLLTAHVYGAFSAISLGFITVAAGGKRISGIVSFCILFVVLLATGSRTPLLGLSVVLLWLAVLRRDLFSISSVFVGLFIACGLWFFYPESLSNRGFSYRPEIWQQAWIQIMDKPWFGHGYDQPMLFKIDSLPDIGFADPHNMELAVLFSGGFLGFIFWLFLYLSALIVSLKNKDSLIIVMASCALVFGFSSGLTEGNSFLSRPKEHWFLIWIPFSLISAELVRKKSALKTEVIT